jgi:hypothetical protein
MGVESSPEYATDLNPSWPLSSDTRREGDDHLRNIKTVIQNLSKNASGDIIDGPILQAALPGGHVTIVYGTEDPNNTAGPAVPGGTWTKIGTIAVTPIGGAPSSHGVWQLTGVPGWEV